jgi:hypothetical protein
LQKLDKLSDQDVDALLSDLVDDGELASLLKEDDGTPNIHKLI